MNVIDFQVTAAIAAASFVAWGVFYAVRGHGTARWAVPAALAGAFGAWSLFAIAREGPLGFWPKHITGVWGNQIWFDLLICASSAFFLAVPRLRAAGMRPLPWFLAIVATGGIGVLAMIARLMLLERTQTA